jgi:hypothetical protein
MSHPMFVINLLGDITEEEALRMLDPSPWERLVWITNPHDACLEALATEAKVFESRSEARKNGFHGPIPHGVEFLGTGSRNFWVWNPHPPEKPVLLGKKRFWTDKWFELALQAGSLKGPDGKHWPVQVATGTPPVLRRIIF